MQVPTIYKAPEIPIDHIGVAMNMQPGLQLASRTALATVQGIQSTEADLASITGRGRYDQCFWLVVSTPLKNMKVS